MSRPKRPYWREHDAERVLAELQASGKSTAAFARQHGISPAKLYRWRAQLQLEPAAADFVPVVLDRATPTPSHAEIELLLGDGVRIGVPRGFCAQTLSRLLAVLGREASC